MSPQVESLELALARMSAEKAGILVSDVQSKHDELWKACKTDIWLWLRHYVETVNLHMEDPDSDDFLTNDPFPDFPHLQMIFETCGVVRPKKALIVKSRDMMFSWAMAALFLHDVMFFDDAPHLMTTYREKLIDDGGEKSTINSLFGRIRHMYLRLPEWMRACAPMRFTLGKILNLENGSFITGIKSSADSGRAGKFRRALADEFGFFEQSEANLAALQGTCPRGLILGSTVGRDGRFCAFGRLAHEKKHGGFTRLDLHYNLHPLRRGNKEWYDTVTEPLKAADIAREYELEFEGAIEARVFPRFDRNVHVRVGCEYDPQLPLYLSFDHGLNEETVTFWQQAELEDEEGRKYIEHRIVFEYQGGVPDFGHKMTVWENVANLKQILHDPPFNMKFDPVPKGDDGKPLAGSEWKYGPIKDGQIEECFADPRGGDLNISVQSRKTDDTRLTSSHEVYRQHGFRLQGKFSKIKDGVTIIEDWIVQRPTYLVIASTCLRTIEAMINHRHKTKKTESGDQILDGVKEDWTKHWADTVRYYAIHVTSVEKTRRAPAKKYQRIWQVMGPTGARRATYVPVTEQGDSNG